jgi:hypothetical protein
MPAQLIDGVALSKNCVPKLLHVLPPSPPKANSRAWR